LTRNIGAGSIDIRDSYGNINLSGTSGSRVEVRSNYGNASISGTSFVTVRDNYGNLRVTGNPTVEVRSNYGNIHYQSNVPLYRPGQQPRQTTAVPRATEAVDVQDVEESDAGTVIMTPEPSEAGDSGTEGSTEQDVSQTEGETANLVRQRSDRAVKMEGSNSIAVESWNFDVSNTTSVTVTNGNSRIHVSNVGGLGSTRIFSGSGQNLVVVGHGANRTNHPLSRGTTQNAHGMMTHALTQSLKTRGKARVGFRRLCLAGFVAGSVGMSAWLCLPTPLAEVTVVGAVLALILAI
jgi:hypothetical protein